MPLGAALSPRRLLSLRVRGRMWIAVLAVGLIGLITAQLVVLRLNTSIGRSLARAATLQRENAAMAIVNSEAGSAEKIEAQAALLGMHAVPPGELQFLRAAGRGRALAAAQALRSASASSATGLTSAPGGGSTGFVTAANGETALTVTAQQSQAAQSSAVPGQEAQEAAANAAVPGQESQAGSAGQAEQPAVASPQGASQTPAAAPETQSSVQAGAALAPAGAGG